MPLAVIRGTMFFSMPDYGWTETLFWQRSTIVLANDLAALDFIAQKRAALLGSGASCFARRVSVDFDLDGAPVRGDASLAKSPSYGGYSTQPLAAPGVSLLVRTENAESTRHRNTYLRGIPDALESDEGTYEPGGVPDWGVRFGSYVAALLGGAGVITGWEHSLVSSPADAQVTNYEELPSGQIQFTTTAGAFQAGMVGKRVPIRISRINAPDKSVLNGQWLVEVDATDSAHTVVPVSAFPFKVAGALKVYTPFFLNSAIVRAENIAFRAPGRPLLVRRGRGRTRPRG